MQRRSKPRGEVRASTGRYWRDPIIQQQRLHGVHGASSVKPTSRTVLPNDYGKQTAPRVSTSPTEREAPACKHQIQPGVGSRTGRHGSRTRNQPRGIKYLRCERGQAQRKRDPTHFCSENHYITEEPAKERSPSPHIM